MTNCLPCFDLDSVTEKKYKYFLREVEKYKIYTRTNLFLFLFLSLSNYSFQGHSSQVKSIGIWYVSQRVEIAKHGAKVWSLFVNVLIPIESRVAFRLYGFMWYYIEVYIRVCIFGRDALSFTYAFKSLSMNIFFLIKKMQTQEKPLA